MSDENEALYYWSETERLVGAVYLGFLAGSPIVASFSGWSLGLLGVSVSVLLSQMADLPFPVQRATFAALWWLIVAAVFAAVGKAAEMFVTSASSSAAAVNREVNRLGDAGLTNIDWDRAEDEILRPLKWPLSLLIRRLKHRHPDNLFTLRLAVTAMQLQALAIALQTICLLGGAVAFAYRGSPAW